MLRRLRLDARVQVGGALRTRSGVMAVHEILAESETGAFFKPLYDMGYGLPECTVYNYWDDGYPAKASDPEVKSLLLKRGAELLLVLCSWRNEPVTATFALDTKALGLTPAAASEPESELTAVQAAIDTGDKNITALQDAMAKAEGAVAEKKPDAEKRLESLRKAQDEARAALEKRKSLLPVVEAANKPITWDAATGTLTVPLEGYGVRVIALH